jgi:probable F420-dependent oxidoreductase
MKFGLHGINFGPYSSPEMIREVAQAAEAAGIDSLWTGEHIILPEQGFSLPAGTPHLDSLLALTYVAAVTKTIKLATGVLILPQRNPLLLAKEIASLDVLSGGRVLAGFGVGFLQPEFQALGVSFEQRGARADEYLQAMQAIWSQEKPVYHGRFVSFEQVQAAPRPLQQPSPPIIIGGSSLPALRRTWRFAQGWFASGPTPETISHYLTTLRQFERQEARPAGAGPLEISMYANTPLPPEIIEHLAKVGVHRLVLSLPGEASRETALRFIEHASKRLLQQERAK